MMYDPDEECDKIISFLKDLCRMKGMSQTMLAQKAGISASTLNNIMNRKTNPGVYTLFKVCNALDVTLEELFGGDCPKTKMSFHRNYV